jgi:hypothetical protein
MAADDHRRAEVTAHIEAVAQRREHEADHLVASLLRRVWPAGPSDRMSPAAAEWVRRWRPTRGGGTLPPVCACGRGACPVCN